MVPLKCHVLKVRLGNFDSALRSNMFVFQSPRAFQALYAGTSGQVSPVDEAMARKVARGTETCAETPRNMVMFTLYHQGTMLGRSCSHSVLSLRIFRFCCSNLFIFGGEAVHTTVLFRRDCCVSLRPWGSCHVCQWLNVDPSNLSSSMIMSHIWIQLNYVVISDNAENDWSQSNFVPTLHSVQTWQTKHDQMVISQRAPWPSLAIPGHPWPSLASEAASVWWEQRHCHLAWLQRRQPLLSKCLPNFKSFWMTGYTDTW